MKKLLIFGIIILSVTGCKKAEITPTEQLTNSIWTGFFKYKPVRENDNR